MNKNLKNKIASIMALTLAIGIVYNGNVIKASEKVSVMAVEHNEVNTREIIVERPLDFKGEVKGLEVTLRWGAPESKEGLVGYTLYKDGKVMEKVNADTTNYKVEGLKENSIYSFKIVSNYSNGKSSKPVSINIRTEIIKAKARNLIAKDVKSDSLTLDWDKPEYPGGLTGYSIYKDGKLLTEVESKTTKVDVTGLTANKIYGFKVVSNYTTGSSKPVSVNVRTEK